MELFIRNGYVYYSRTAEKIDLNTLNKGLTNFYGAKVEINNDNLNEFSSDIEALCFGFNN